MRPPRTLSDTQLAILANAAARDDLNVLPTPKTLKARGAALTNVINALVIGGLVEETSTIEDCASPWRRSRDGDRVQLRVSRAGLIAIGLEGDEADPDCEMEQPHSLEAGGGLVARPEADAISSLELGMPIPGRENAQSAAEYRSPPDSAKLASDTAAGGEMSVSVSIAPQSTYDTQLANPASQRTSIRAGSKGARILTLLGTSGGASINEMMAASGWQAHSVRGFLSGVVKKKLGLKIVSTTNGDGVRLYQIN